MKASSRQKFIVARELGILNEMQKEVPLKQLIPAHIEADNTCACSECSYMKINTLQKTYDCLLYESPEIEVSDGIIEKSILPIERMLQLS
ncbi:quinolinate synthase NadA [Algoriphagus chordae]|uniref:quinolinate synthase NadA n=1 Tax=Algoriphagus chordae TaxID=237019 RepID=UPI001B87CC5F